jgi:MFS family permease
MINNLVFYGVGLKSADLGVNPYLSFTLSAVVEFLAYVLTHLILDRLGRKVPYFVFLFLAGISCLLIGFLGKYKMFQILSSCRLINY